MNFLKYNVLLLLFAFFYIPTHPANALTGYSKRFDGYSTGIIRAVHVHDKQVWLATENGLFGLSGPDVVKFDISNSILASNYIVDIERFDKESFVIGSFGDGLYRYTVDTGKISRVSVPLRNIRSIWSISSNTKYLVLNTITDVHVLNKSSLALEFSLSQVSSQKSSDIRHVSVTEQAMWWIDSGHVVKKIDFSDHKISSYSSENNFSQDIYFSSLYVDDKDVVVGSNKGVFRLDTNEERFHSLASTDNILQRPVYKIGKNLDGDLIFSAGSLYKISISDDKLYESQEFFQTTKTNQFDAVLDFHFDQSNNFYGADGKKGFFYIPYKSNGAKILYSPSSHALDTKVDGTEVTFVASDNISQLSMDTGDLITISVKSDDSYQLIDVRDEKVWLINSNSEITEVDIEAARVTEHGNLFSSFRPGLKTRQVVVSASGKIYALVSAHNKDMVLEWDFNAMRSVFEGNVSKIAVSLSNELYLAEIYKGIYRVDLSSDSLDVKKDSSLALAGFPCLHPDRENRLWICGDGEGLYLREDKETRQLPAFANYYIRGIAQVTSSLFLVATNSGLYAYDIERHHALFLGEEFGIKDVDFEYDGLATGLQYTVVAGDENTYLIHNNSLESAIQNYLQESHTTTISLVSIQSQSANDSPRNQAFFKLESPSSVNVPGDYVSINLKIASDNFIGHATQKLEYLIEGVHSEWQVENSNPAFVKISRLPAGSYRVKSRVSDAHRQHPIAQLQLIVAPPFWRSTLAISCYVLLFLLFISAVTLITRHRNTRHQQAIAQREQEQRDLVKANKAYLKAKIGRKQQLFLRISHELQTPLSLILGPLQQMRQTPGDKQNTKRIEVINRNARRLHLLVNQLLEVERLDAVKAQPMQSYALAQQLPLILANLEAVLLARQQTLVSKLKVTGHIRLTSNALETILHRMLRFAAGRTPANGTVQLHAKCDELHLQLRILTSGEPLGEQEACQLFDQFTAPADTALREDWQNSLALVQEVVLANDGWLGVDPSSEDGMCLRISLPMVSAAKTAASAPALVMEEVRPVPVVDPDRPVIVIADNNADMRRYLLEALKTRYTCLEAGDGRQVMQIIRSVTPALIVCQAQLTHTNGISLATSINNPSEHAHIPFVLTCYSPDAGFQEQCSRAGVDAVLSQPVQVTDLQSCVARLLTLHERYRRQAINPVAPKTPFTVPQFSCSREQAFYTRVLAVLEQHYQNEGFCRADAAQALAISERQMARKLGALFNQPFNELLKRYRLHQAKALLEDGMQITQVAFAVGFGTSSYFSSSFKAEYAQTPSQYQEGAARLAAS